MGCFNLTPLPSTVLILLCVLIFSHSGSLYPILYWTYGHFLHTSSKNGPVQVCVFLVSYFFPQTLFFSFPEFFSFPKSYSPIPIVQVCQHSQMTFGDRTPVCMCRHSTFIKRTHGDWKNLSLPFRHSQTLNYSCPGWASRLEGIFLRNTTELPNKKFNKKISGSFTSTAYVKGN